ncbi:hypothetical protein [uncultured Roseobacter sp.]|uniref:phosphoribosylanthranilate isomerase n=1 Tax=uncultured Roseobacter sp. TaxID=114847 RepID=UPI002633D7E1|nr:hypothetical protein [uncultured Roseobacter sp.]
MDLKICGVTTPEELEILNQEGARYAGLWTGIDGHPRNLTDAKFIELVELCESVTPVAVCVRRPVSDLWQLLQLSGVRHVQLHGFNRPSDVRYLKDRGVTLIKTIHVGDDGNCPAERLIDPYIDAGCDIFLIDRFGGTEAIGSSGVELEPDTLQNWRDRLTGQRVWLAGGLTADRIADLAESPGIETVDVDTAARRQGGAIQRKAARMLVLATAPAHQIGV